MQSNSHCHILKYCQSLLKIVPASHFPLGVLLMYFVFSSSLEKVLEAITTAGEWGAIERFNPIVQGLRERSVQLQVSAK